MLNIPGFKIKIKFNVIMKLVINLLLLIRGGMFKIFKFVFIYLFFPMFDLSFNAMEIHLSLC
jgi:hypothetical protein